MKLVNNIGLVVMAIWLIAEGIIAFFQINIASINFVLPILAIIAGVLLLLRLRENSTLVNIGLLLLSVWLILTGVGPLLNLTLPGMEVILAGLGLVAGVVMLVGQ